MESDKRWLIGGAVVGGAIVALVLMFVLATLRAADPNGALAAVTGTMGTILGAYFGVAAGGAGTSEARLRAEHGEQEIEALRIENNTLHQQLLEKQFELGKHVGRQKEQVGPVEEQVSPAEQVEPGEQPRRESAYLAGFRRAAEELVTQAEHAEEEHQRERTMQD